MQLFIARQNVLRFRDLLDTETDPYRRIALSRLLSEATRELARLEKIWLWTCPGLPVPEDVGIQIEDTLASVVETGGADFGSVQFLSPPTHKLHLMAQRNFPGSAAEQFAVVDEHSNTVCARCLETKAEMT